MTPKCICQLANIFDAHNYYYDWGKWEIKLFGQDMLLVYVNSVGFKVEVLND